jgi:hypothetical protein
MAQYLAQFQIQPWWVVSASASVNKTLLGFNEKQSPVTVLNPAALFISNNKTSNFLGKFEKRVFVNVNFASLAQSTLQSIPWVNLTNINSAESLDSFIATQIKTVIELLKKKDKGILLQSAPNQTDLAKFYAEINSEILPVVPHGGIYIGKLDVVKKILDVTLATGRDIRIDRSSGFPNQGFRQMQQMSQLTNGLRMLPFFSQIF